MTTATIIETRRLSLRPFEPADDQAAFQWFSDPRVMKYIPSGPDRSIDQTRARIASYRAHQDAHNFSKWLIVERASGRPIGDAGLMILEKEGWTDLGFRLAAAYWGRGFATEVASLWVRVAFHELGLKSLGAFSHMDNAASIKVLQKVGFQRIRSDIIRDMPSVVFNISAEAQLFASRT